MFIFKNRERKPRKYFDFFRHCCFGSGGQMLQFVSSNNTITPVLTVSGGPTPIWDVTESTGIAYRYESASFSHTKTAGTGNLTVRLVNTEAVKDFVTGISFDGDNLISTINDLQLRKFLNLASVNLLNNSNLTGDFVAAFININNATYLSLPNTGLSGNFTNVDLSNVITTINIRDNTGFYGDLNTTSISASLANFYAYGCNFDSGIRIPIATSSIQNYAIQNNGLLQSAVDQIISDIFENRFNFTYANPSLNVGGTNAAPSGIYQDATPPTTGKEYIYKLVNDPDLEGFNKWTITYTA